MEGLPYCVGEMDRHARTVAFEVTLTCLLHKLGNKVYLESPSSEKSERQASMNGSDEAKQCIRELELAHWLHSTEHMSGTVIAPAFTPCANNIDPITPPAKDMRCIPFGNIVRIVSSFQSSREEIGVIDMPAPFGGFGGDCEVA
jgi:hypothetical protein